MGMAALFAFALVSASTFLSGKVAQAQAQLAAFDLDRALLVSGVQNGAFEFVSKDGSPPTGRIDQFLMSLQSADALSQLPGISSMHEYRQLPREAQQGDTPPAAVDVHIVPPGFLQAHGLGSKEADAALQRGCLVADRRWMQRQTWTSEESVHWMPTADIRRIFAERAALQRERNLPVGNNGEYDAPVCAADLVLPKGIGTFENAVFISTEHPELQGKSTFAIPQLWLSIAPEADAKATLARVQHFLAHEAEQAQPSISLQVHSFADQVTQAVNGDQLRQWQRRLGWISWLAGLLLLLTLLLMRWGALRRELALRRALGQPPAVAWRRVGGPYANAILGGSLLGTALAMPLALWLWRAPWGQAAAQAGQLLMVAVCAVVLLSLALIWALREAPLQVLNQGAR